MPKTLFYIFFLIIVIHSCKEENQSKEIEISNQFKLEFLNQILSDTNKLRIITSKEQLIATGDLTPGMMPMGSESGKSISHFKFISDSLGVNDIEFIKKQFVDNKEFDFNKLADYGFRVLDIENFKNLNDSISLYDYTEKINKGFNSYYRVIITKPIFNKSLNKAYVMINDYGGRTIVLEKRNGIWEIVSQFHDYME
ncbi:hypothetical protein DHD05_22150 [Arenibacter sp. N53]|uniref:hypothetical protein n=1 Tax=Arenibacter TaxID=178469 RepID=UPI000CD49ABC|nr:MULTISPECIES: hypothetical protein [Arenibacter]MCM4154297.1 hypothetical protein [Arenibacter sp. N53]